MSELINKVALVLDPDYGDKLTSLADVSHVWVIDTPSNRTVASEYWALNPTHQAELGITTFSSENKSRLESCLKILETVDMHHGPHSSDPPYSVLEVIGLPLTDEAKAAIEDLGFETFETTVAGFRATR
jgi:hypothetical protein